MMRDSGVWLAREIVLVSALVLVAIGGCRSSREAAPSDASFGDADPDSPPDAAPDAPNDAPCDAPSGLLAITGVTLEGIADRQVRQGGQGTLVIRGSGLDRVTSARLGDLEIAIPEATSASSLRLAIAIPHGHPLGMLDLALADRDGTASAAGAIEVTPIVVTSSGIGAGRGTFAAPTRLCQAWDALAAAGDTLLLRNGMYVCNGQLRIPSGVSVAGESRTGTVVRSRVDTRFRGFRVVGVAGETTQFKNLTIEDSEEGIRSEGPGVLSVSSVDVLNTVSGITVVGGSARVDGYRYTRQERGRGDIGLTLLSGRLEAAHVEIVGTINVDGGSLTVTDGDLRGGTYVVFVSGADEGTRPVVEIVRTTIRASVFAMFAYSADLVIRDSTIEELGQNVGVGIELDDGSLSVFDSTIRGFGDIGILIGGFVDQPVSRQPVVTLIRTQITEADVGVQVINGLQPGRLTLRDTHIAAEREAVSLAGSFAAVDLGTAASGTTNRLDVAAGGTALHDTRTAADADIEAHGLVLNGRTFAGDVIGPAAVPDAYDIGPNTIHF